jgi:hypothetical protein
VVAVNPVAVYWALSGMETALFLLLVAGAIWSTSRFIEGAVAGMPPRRLRVQLAASLALLVLVRWEGAALAIALASLGSLAVFLSHPDRSWRSRAVVAVRSPLAVPTLTLVALLAFNTVYYRSIVPDPVAFKRVFHYYQRSQGEAVDAMVDFARTSLGWPVVLLTAIASVAVLVRVGSAALKGRVDSDATPLVAAAALGAFLLVSARSDFSRYELALLVPAAMVALELLPVGAASATFSETPRTASPGVPLRALQLWSRRRLIGGIAVVTLLATALPYAWFGQEDLTARTSGFLYVQEARGIIGRRLEAETRPGTVVLSGDLGALSFYNIGNVYVDANGLTNRSLIAGLEAGTTYSKLIEDRHPAILVDTADATLVTGSEKLFDNPSGYFDVKPVPAGSTCHFISAFDKEPWMTEPRLTKARMAGTDLPAEDQRLFVVAARLRQRPPC